MDTSLAPVQLPKQFQLAVRTSVLIIEFDHRSRPLSDYFQGSGAELSEVLDGLFGLLP